MKAIIYSLALFFCVGLSASASAQETIASECGFDNDGEFCINNEGVYGYCTEDGPNSCEGENPDFPGECRGYPNCSGDYGVCFEKEAGEACKIITFQNGEEVEGTGICEVIEGDDDYLNCNLEADNASPIEEEEGCNVAPISSPMNHSWVGLLGLVALGLVWRKRSAHSHDI